MNKTLSNSVRTCVVAAALFVIEVSPAAAVAVVNGSFEADPWPCFISQPTVTGWTTGGSQSPYSYGAHNCSEGHTPFGDQYFLLGSFGRGGAFIEQTINGFIPGDDYALGFAISSETSNAGSRVQVSFLTGSSTSPVTFTAPPTGGVRWDTWGSFSEPFHATASTITLQFLDMGGAGYDASLDNVSVTGGQSNGVPEPTSIALLGLGLAGLGFSRRRKIK